MAETAWPLPDAFDDLTDEPTVEAMEALGGSFIKALAECWRRADPCNKSILKYAFAAYWRDYERKAASMTTRAERRRGASHEWHQHKQDPRAGGVDVTGTQAPHVRLGPGGDFTHDINLSSGMGDAAGLGEGGAR